MDVKGAQALADRLAEAAAKVVDPALANAAVAQPAIGPRRDDGGASVSRTPSAA